MAVFICQHIHVYINNHNLCMQAMGWSRVEQHKLIEADNENTSLGQAYQSASHSSFISNSSHLFYIINGYFFPKCSQLSITVNTS